MSDIEREDALDAAMSGQSYTERLIDSVCSELNAMAVDLKICHTVNGEWPASEKDTIHKHDHLRRMAVELRKLKSARTQAPASGEVDEKGSLPWFVEVYNHGYQAGHNDTVEGYFTPVHYSDLQTYHEDEVIELLEGLNVEASKIHPPAKVPEGIDVAVDMLEDYASALGNGDLDGAGHSTTQAIYEVISLLTKPTTGAVSNEH